MHVSVRNQKGFSLVELMVVVAIIGILAAIAVPNFQRFSAKAKQSEAKANLSAIYSAEKAFIGEWQTYDADFLAVGYKPDGFLNYRLTQGALVTTPANYTGPVPVATNNVTTAVCGANAIGGTSGTCGEIINGGVGCAAPAGGAIAMTANAFSSQASSVLYGGGAAPSDTWQIDNFKQVTNPTSGLP